MTLTTIVKFVVRYPWWKFKVIPFFFKYNIEYQDFYSDAFVEIIHHATKAKPAKNFELVNLDF